MNIDGLAGNNVSVDVSVPSGQHRGLSQRASFRLLFCFSQWTTPKHFNNTICSGLLFRGVKLYVQPGNPKRKPWTDDEPASRTVTGLVAVDFHDECLGTTI